MVRGSGYSKQVGREVPCKRKKQAILLPYHKCEKEDPGQVLTAPSLGRIPIMMEPSGFILLPLRAGSCSVRLPARSGSSEKECNLEKELGWAGQRTPTSYLLNPVWPPTPLPTHVNKNDSIPWLLVHHPKAFLPSPPGFATVRNL